LFFSSFDGTLSTVRVTAATDLLVYSSLAAYGSRRGGALPGSWFVAALGPLGHDAAAVRQTLLRMERAGELTAERRGRHKLYRLTPLAAAATAAGAEKIHAEPAGAWDGCWTTCVYTFTAGDRARRDRVRDLLAVEGFAQLARGIMVHVRDRTARIAAALAGERRAPPVTLFRGASLVGGEPRALVARLWNVRDLATRYRRMLARHEPLAQKHLAPAAAFSARFALVVDYLDVAWDDPDLPPELLPADWPGHEARRFTRTRYDELLPATLAHGDTVVRDVAAETLVPLP
jgi:phenylacetic acid degradation operon negative regulatory protein